MKILQLCNKPPYPSVDGGMIAMQAITSGLLQAKHEVKVFAISTKKHPVKIRKRKILAIGTLHDKLHTK